MGQTISANNAKLRKEKSEFEIALDKAEKLFRGFNLYDELRTQTHEQLFTRWIYLAGHTKQAFNMQATWINTAILLSKRSVEYPPKIKVELKNSGIYLFHVAFTIKDPVCSHPEATNQFQITRVFYREWMEKKDQPPAQLVPDKIL